MTQMMRILADFTEGVKHLGNSKNFLNVDYQRIIHSPFTIHH
jgi:hypothetical protein